MKASFVLMIQTSSHFKVFFQFFLYFYPWDYLYYYGTTTTMVNNNNRVIIQNS